MGLILVLFGACQDDGIDPKTAQQNAGAAAKQNSQIVAVTEEVMDITEGIFVSRGFTGGRVGESGPGHDGDGEHDDDDDNDKDKDHGDKHHDSRGCLPSISGSFNLDRSHKDSLIYTGVFVVDYGDGSSCPDSAHVRKGKVIDSIAFIVTFKDTIKFTSTETITFDGFWKDSTQLDGEFIIKASTGNPTTVEAVGAKITYADGTSFSWDGTLTFVYEKKGSRHCKGSVKKITEGHIEGTTRDGAEFSATVVEEVVLKRCHGKKAFVPVSGVVEVTSGGATSTLDFGDGSCDKKFTTTTAGETVEHEFS